MQHSTNQPRALKTATRIRKAAVADVCLVLEGTYPYVRGGVASWAHDLIRNQNHLTFHLVVILAPGSSTRMRFELPANVLTLTNVFLSEMPPGASRIAGQEEFFAALKKPLLKFHNKAHLRDLETVCRMLSGHKTQLGRSILLDSKETWTILEQMYRSSFRGGSFVEYFWCWRNIFGGLFSLLLAPLPEAKVYHTVCTGFAGLYAARAGLETGRPVILTEHGIYTNERRIELGLANWFRELKKNDFSPAPAHIELRDLWLRTFVSYSHICYEASQKIVTLFRGNQVIQKLEGAELKRLCIIPNGVDYERFASIQRAPQPGQPTIALIGRVVPIKGIKMFIVACQMIKKEIPDLHALLLGPTDEDIAYFQECKTLVEQLGLASIIEFCGQVKLDDFLNTIDVVVLTSVSEAQPLVILEAGAAGVPIVATNVGACSELIYGGPAETPPLGAGGAVTPVSDAAAIAHEVIKLLRNESLRERCGSNLKKRISLYYTSKQQHASYRDLYAGIMERSGALPQIWNGL